MVTREAPIKVRCHWENCWGSRLPSGRTARPPRSTPRTPPRYRKKPCQQTEETSRHPFQRNACIAREKERERQRERHLNFQSFYGSFFSRLREAVKAKRNRYGRGRRKDGKRLFPFRARMTAKCVSNECREQNTVTFREDQTGGPSVRELVLADIAS